MKFRRFERNFTKLRTFVQGKRYKLVKINYPSIQLVKCSGHNANTKSRRDDSGAAVAWRSACSTATTGVAREEGREGAKEI